MKFSKVAVSLFLFTRSTTAWTAAHVPAGFHRLALASLHSVATDYSSETVGTAATESFRLKFKEGSKVVSPWHDIPLRNDDGSYNMVRLLCQRW
jgi:hypothetical protein